MAVETQLEMADALIREDMPEVQRLMQQTLEKMGITPDQMDDLAKQILNQLREQPGEGPQGGQLPPDDFPQDDGEPPRPVN